MAGMHGFSGAALLFGLGALLLVLFVYPALLMLITRSMVRFRPGYWRCFAVVLLSAIIAAIIGLVLRGAASPAVMTGVGLVINLILITLFLRAFVKHPDGAPLAQGRAFASALVYVIIVGIIGFGIQTSVHHMQAAGAWPTPPAHT